MPLDVSFVAAFSAGLLTFLSPCILPLVPAYLCFISGQSLEQLTEKEQRNAGQVLWAGLAFVLGISAVFISMGAAATSLGQMIAVYKSKLSLVGGAVIIIFGLHYMGVLRISFLNFEKRLHLESKPAGWIGAFILGLAFGFGWTPCVGPVLSTILMIAGGMGEVSNGVLLLTVYSIGLGIPFLIAAALTGPFMTFLSRFRTQMRRIEIAMGTLLVATGLLIVTGGLNRVTVWMLDTFPILNGLN